MLKKLILAIAVVATSSFATWDYFPVQEAGKGSAKAGLYYDFDGDWSQMGLTVSGRFAVIQGLELSLQGFGYQFWSETDCDGCLNGGDGLRDLTLGVRYQMMPIVNIFLDLNLPMGSDGVSSEEFAIYLGGQFAMALAEGFILGTEAAFDWGFEHDNYERGLDFHIGAELDYTIGNTGFTPFLGLKFKLKITEDTYEVGKEEAGRDNSGDNQISVWLGTNYAISPMINVKAQIIIRSGDGSMGGNATGFYAGAEVFF